jgi:hypothetical protein
MLLPSSLLLLQNRCPLLQNNSRRHCSPKLRIRCPFRAPSNEVRPSDKISYSFNFESEIQKVKIPMPLTELMKNDIFKSAILSFKLAFQVTNNIAEYEALILGLNAAKDRGIKNIKVFGDADLDHSASK